MLASQVNQLEIIDKILLRYIFDAHPKTGIEWLYSDAGKLNLGSLMQIRRLMYLWHILSRGENELIRRVYTTQKLSSNTGDWIGLVEQDKQQLGIDMSDHEIQGVSKEMFKRYVSKKVKNNFLKYLNDIKSKHSKSSNLKCDEIKTAEYLLSPKFSLKEKILLFKLRSRTLDIKGNFKKQYKDSWCISCGLFEETQKHLLQCPEIVSKLNYLAGSATNLDENDIYEGVDKQEKIIKVYSDILEIREELKMKKIEENFTLSDMGGPNAHVTVL